MSGIPAIFSPCLPTTVTYASNQRPSLPHVHLCCEFVQLASYLWSCSRAFRRRTVTWSGRSHTRTCPYSLEHHWPHSRRAPLEPTTAGHGIGAEHDQRIPSLQLPRCQLLDLGLWLALSNRRSRVGAWHWHRHGEIRQLVGDGPGRLLQCGPTCSRRSHCAASLGLCERFWHRRMARRPENPKKGKGPRRMGPRRDLPFPSRCVMDDLSTCATRGAIITFPPLTQS